jgi:C4-dicarboxylate-specific signal transduction histidine kinase
LNLVMNAVEAMSRSGNAMRVLRLRTETGPASTVVVSVVDSGPRVDPEVVSKMFQLFSPQNRAEWEWDLQSVKR